MPNMANHPREGLVLCYGAVVVAVSTTAEALLTNSQIWRLCSAAGIVQRQGYCTYAWLL